MRVETMQQIRKTTSFSRRKFKDSRGISLMYVIVVGGVSASAAIALGGSLFPACKHVLSLSNRDEVITIAENSAEFATRKLNQLLKTESIQSITISQLTPPDTATNKAEVQVSLLSADLEKLKTGNLYSPGKFQIEAGVFITNPLYKVLNVTAAKNGYKHTISLILAPVYVDPRINSTSANDGSSNGPSTAPTPLFTNALEANQSLAIGDAIKIGMEDGSSTGADVSGNGFAVLGANTKIDGNLQIYTPPNPDGSIGTSIKTPSSVTVGGNVASSGSIVDSAGGSAPPLTSDSSATGNVLGDGNLGPVPRAGEVGTDAKQSYSPGIDIPNTSGPARITYSGTDPTGFSMPQNANSSTVADLGNISIESGNTMTLAPGNYIADSISVKSGATLKLVGGNDSGFTGVKLFVQGNSLETLPIDIQGNVSFDSTVSKSPNNLQMYYGGTKTLSFSVPNSTSFRGLIYAPSAKLGITLGNQSTFHGSAVAKDLSLSNMPGSTSGTFLFNKDAAMISSPASGVAAGPTYSLKNGSPSAEFNIQHYRVVSWQDLPNK